MRVVKARAVIGADDYGTDPGGLLLGPREMRVKPAAVFAGTWTGRASAYRSTRTSTTTGPPLWLSAACRPSRTSPGSSIRMPLAPSASGRAGVGEEQRVLAGQLA